MQRPESPLNKLKTAIQTMFLSCREVARMQTKALDQALGRRQRLALQLHLLVCSWCRRYGKQIRLLRKVRLEQSEPLSQPNAPSLTRDARERMKRVLDRRDE